MPYDYGGLIFRGAYFRNFTVASDTIDTLGLESWLSRLTFGQWLKPTTRRLLKFPKKTLYEHFACFYLTNIRRLAPVHVFVLFSLNS